MEAEAAECEVNHHISNNSLHLKTRVKSFKMSLAEEPSEENDLKEPEICLQEDDERNESDPEDQKDKNMRTKDFLQTGQKVRRSISPLTLLKEDFNQFKEDVLKVFKDKETECEDRPSTQAEGNLVSSTLDLLKEDLSQFREDVTSVFSIVSSSKDKETKPTEKTANRLSFLKNDLSNVFKLGLSKERDAAKEDSSDTFKIKVSRAERTDEPFRSLFRRDQKMSQKENGRGLTETETDEQEEKIMKDELDELENGELDGTEEMIPTSHTAEQRSESEERSEHSSVVSAEDERTKEGEEEGEEEEDKEDDDEKEKEDDTEEDDDEDDDDEKPSETVPWESLSSGISLFSLSDSKKDDARDQPRDDVWSLKNFACYLTFDPNTANPELHLTDCNRRATRVWSDHRPSHHPDRFRRCPQVLCREGLLDSVYWEVLWSGGADIGVTYTSISRDGDAASCLLGHNEQSWSLECSEGSYTPCHDKKRFRSSSPRPFTHRVGVYLDWSAGSLSFYCVSQDAMVHLHTFTSTFTEPLYPGFWVWAYDGSVTLCQVELDWERLLQ